MGIISSYTDLLFLQAVAVAVAIMVLWEIVEGITHTVESAPGILSDLVVGSLGFIVGSVLVANAFVLEYRLYVLTVACIVAGVLGYMGWVAYMKRERGQ